MMLPPNMHSMDRPEGLGCMPFVIRMMRTVVRMTIRTVIRRNHAWIGPLTSRNSSTLMMTTAELCSHEADTVSLLWDATCCMTVASGHDLARLNVCCMSASQCSMVGRTTKGVGNH